MIKRIMHKKEKMKEIIFLEKPDNTNSERQHHIPEHLKPKCKFFILGISDSKKISLEKFYRKRHYFLTGIPHILTKFSHYDGFS
jgi:hypothetical protein